MLRYGIDSELSRIAEKIYADFHKPSRRTSTHHLLMVGDSKGIISTSQNDSGEYKKDEFKRERVLACVAKIPIANTLNELVELDFVYYGYYAAFLHIMETSSRFPVAVFICTAEKGEQTSGMARETLISHWLARAWGARYFDRRQRYGIYRKDLSRFSPTA